MFVLSLINFQPFLMINNYVKKNEQSWSVWQVYRSHWPLITVQGDQLYVAVFFWYLGKSDLSSAHVFYSMYTLDVGQVTFYKVLDIHGHAELVTLYVMCREDDVFLLLDADELPTRESIIFLKETDYLSIHSRIFMSKCCDISVGFTPDYW